MHVRLLLVPLLVTACGAPSRHPSAAPPPDDPSVSAVRRAVEPLFEEEVLHGGMVIALVDPAKPAPSYLGFGRTSPDDADPPTADTLFEIGSVSKVLTALLLADSARRGEVQLDEPAAQLVPLGVRFPDADGVRPTLAELASHRSGLPSIPDNLAPKDPNDPFAGYGERELDDYLERAQLQFVPGQQYAYSNLGSGILGDLLARTIGTTYEQAVKTRILAPLGLASTLIKIPPPLQTRMAAGTSAGGDPAGPWTYDVLAGSGAWRSSARDMAKLVATAASAAAGKDVPLAEDLRTSFQPLGDAGPGMQVALGWHITDQGIVWHNGMTGGYSSFIGFDPASRHGVVILASTASPLVTRLGIDAFGVFSGKTLDLGLGIVEVSSADLDRLAGTYLVQGGTKLVVTHEGNALWVAMDKQRVRLYPTSSTTFLVLELSATVEFAIEGSHVRGFVFHLPQGDIQAEREVAP